MARNPRVLAAYRAMRALGIAEATVKPVLKNLLRLYEKNWELIEEENYRALADAIFEYEETKVDEQKKQSEIADQDNILEGKTQLHDEPARPLKRLRLRNQESQVSPSLANSSQTLGGAVMKRPKLEDAEQPQTLAERQPQGIAETPEPSVGNIRPELQPVSSPQAHLVNKGKQPALPQPLALQGRSDLSPTSATKRAESDLLHTQQHLRDKGKETLSLQIAAKEKRSIPVRSFHLNAEPGIILSPKRKVHDTPALMKPKDEPYTDDILQLEVPIAVIHPDPLHKRNFPENNSTGKLDGPQPPVNSRVDGEDEVNGGPASSSGAGTNCELANISNLEIASSPLGEVKISLSCNSAHGKPDFRMPSLDTLLKLVEDKCLRSYKIIDPNFSVTKLMRDMCDCFLELGTHTEESHEGSINTTPTGDLLGKSTAPDAVGSCGDEENFSMSSCITNGSFKIQCSTEVAVPQIPRLLSTSLNGLGDHIQLNSKITENSCGENGQEKETNGPNNANSLSLVLVQQRQLTPDDIRFIHDVDDITKGEEKVRIPLVNETNSEFPTPFHYISQNLVFQNAYMNLSLARIGIENCCSTCFGDCLSSSTPCACACESGGDFAYTLEGLVKEDFLEECISRSRDPQQHQLAFCQECPLERSKAEDILEPCKGHIVRKFIKECWSKCGCSKQCRNRLVQRGITCNFQVFLTPDGKGWGLRTLEDLPKGSFVCEYVGEILTTVELYERNMQSTSRGKKTYPVLLDADWALRGILKDEEALCLDATFYGNVARFINHRCLDANLVEIPVEVESPDHHYYHLALFTTRKVNALEELTWDYGIDFDDQDHPVKTFRCCCGSKFCRNMKRTRSRSALSLG